MQLTSEQVAGGYMVLVTKKKTRTTPYLFVINQAKHDGEDVASAIEKAIEDWVLRRNRCRCL